MGNEQVGELRAVLQSERIEREREFRDLTDEIARLRSTRHPWCSDVPRDTAIRAAEDAAASERPSLPDHRELPKIVAEMREHHSEMIGQLFKRVAALDAARLFGVTESRSADARTEETSQTARPCGGTDPAPPCGERGAAGKDIRTERVTLEITHVGAWPHPSKWAWHAILDDSISAADGESVRVVPQSDAAAEVERLRAEVASLQQNVRWTELDRLTAWRERDAATKERDRWCAQSGMHEKAANAATARADAKEATLRGCAESMAKANREITAERDALKARVAGLEALQKTQQLADAEPVAWAATRDNGSIADAGTSRREMEHISGMMGGTVVPLFLAPPPQRGWLIQLEREALTRAMWSGERMDADADCVAALLSRNSPPRVQMPKVWGNKERVIYVEEMRAALAEAGVEVDG